jgi:hypothetical protein
VHSFADRPGGGALQYPLDCFPCLVLWLPNYRSIDRVISRPKGYQHNIPRQQSSAACCLLSKSRLTAENSTSFVYIIIFPPRINKSLQLWRCRDIEVSVSPRILPTSTSFGAPCANIPIRKVNFELNTRRVSVRDLLWAYGGLVCVYQRGYVDLQEVHLIRARGRVVKSPDCYQSGFEI